MRRLAKIVIDGLRPQIERIEFELKKLRYEVGALFERIHSLEVRDKPEAS